MVSSGITGSGHYSFAAAESEWAWVGCVPGAGEELKGLGSSRSAGGGLSPERSPEAISLSGGEFRSGGVCPQDSTVLGPDNWTGGSREVAR